MTRRLPQLGTNERQLILNCARLDLGGPLRQQAEVILQQPLAWDAILLFAEFHSVAPLLHSNLKGLDAFEFVPPEARRRLLQLSHRTGYQNRHYARALRELLEVFAEADITVIVLKGLSLVELIYGGLSLRPLIDLNLLVPVEKLDRAKGILFRIGYGDKIRSPLRGFYRWAFSQLHLLNQRDFEVNLLLQRDLVNRPRIYNIDLRQVWAEAQPVRMVGCDAFILSPVDLVLYLSVQSDKSGFLNAAATHLEDPAAFVFTEWTENRLIRFTDIYEVIKHYQGAIDWEVLIERARVSGIEGSVYTNLHWVTQLLGSVTDPWVLDALRPPSPRRIHKWMFEALVEQNKGAKSVKASFRAWWLKMHKRSQLRLISLLELLEFIFPRRDELELYYRLHSKSTVFSVYLIHVAKSLFRSALGFPPWLYCMLTRRRSSATLSEETPSREASRP